jgi:hypothetical protein
LDQPNDYQKNECQRFGLGFTTGAIGLGVVINHDVDERNDTVDTNVEHPVVGNT